MNEQVQKMLGEYLTFGEQRRLHEARVAMQTLTAREQHLVREAAIMGFVRGQMRGEHTQEVPGDAVIVQEVLNCCAAMPDHYPVLAAAARGARRRPQWLIPRAAAPERSA